MALNHDIIGDFPFGTNVRAVEYFYTRVEDDPGRAYDLLARVAFEDIKFTRY